MNNPKLSICIPTYNRADCLDDCLQTIVSQFTNPVIKDQVEVIISDNASTDHTTQIVKRYQEKYQNIRYFKNESNLGFDRNLLNVIEKSTGQYCFSIGDDDGFFPDCFEFLLNKFHEEPAPYYMVNCWGYDHNLKEPIVPHPNRQITTDQIYIKLSKFVESIKDFNALAGNFGGISVQVFDRKIWMDFKEKEEYIGTQIIHFFVLLGAFKESKFVLLAKACVKTRNENMRWDISPGLETIAKRVALTRSAVTWINDKYKLGLSQKTIHAYFIRQFYILYAKDFAKNILRRFGLRS